MCGVGRKPRILKIKKILEESIIKNIRNLLKLKKKIKQSNAKQLKILETFLSMKRKKINTNQ